MYKDNWTKPWPMGSEIYPKVHENPRAFFSCSSPILLEPLAHVSGDWSLPREDCTRCLKARDSLWYLGSGCSRHMTGDKCKPSDFVSKGGGYVMFGDNSKEKIVGETNIGKN